MIHLTHSTKLGNDPETPTGATHNQTELTGHVLAAPNIASDGHVPLDAEIGQSDHAIESDPDHAIESDHTFALTTTPVPDSITRAVVVRLPWKIVPFVIGVFIIVEVTLFSPLCYS